jgi:hypothetical protein
MNHGQTRTHKTNHGLDLGEATTFPFIVYFVPGRGASTQMSFCPGIPTLEIPKIGMLATLEGHNFMCKASIEMRSEAKLFPSSRSFQGYVAHHLHAHKLGRFPTFSGRESNYQFDSQPFFWP